MEPIEPTVSPTVEAEANAVPENPPPTPASVSGDLEKPTTPTQSDEGHMAIPPNTPVNDGTSPLKESVSLDKMKALETLPKTLSTELKDGDPTRFESLENIKSRTFHKMTCTGGLPII
ncbi:hypothetical protein H072_3373 [Dactylellina haptotyla CBS 200.50]|uniref:Uncharacterized protein n=1 Tax=Dactylellina haptotyla (strain CBS 200.50) TaxID=1284197 RepID=S8AHW8_DACHA|nr:hypothetical protein H072_3373 [Dactylellina haptotyla CBS 200.50]